MIAQPKEYSIDQFPKNKDQAGLSTEQAAIRQRAKKIVYNGTERQCRRCQKILPITEFYKKEKNGERRAVTCRDCQLERAGVVEVGKQRYEKAIAKKGFRRCNGCKETFLMSSFPRNKNSRNGYGHTCQTCITKKHRKFMKDQRKALGDFYVRQYGKYNYGMEVFGDEDMARLRAEIIAKQQPKFHIDGKGFIALSEFAQYLFEIYNISVDRTCKRIEVGYSEIDCLLTETEVRRRSKVMGGVVVTDTVTGKITHYLQSTDPKLQALFSKTSITRAIKSGKPTRVTRISKYKHPCTIIRLSENLPT